MADKNQTEGVEPKATPIAAGEPVEDVAISQMGATFAERRAAREAAEGKAVHGDAVEDKAVSRKSTRTKKKS